MHAPHPASLKDEALLAQCDLKRGKGSGPGGQRRNKVQTAVLLTHRPTGLTGQASERREAEANKRSALGRLRLALALEIRTAWSVPSALWVGRRQGDRLPVNPRHVDVPALIAEALDALASTAWDDALAAQRLGISRTQLLKLLRIDHRGIALLNTKRSARGNSPVA